MGHKDYLTKSYIPPRPQGEEFLLSLLLDEIGENYWWDCILFQLKLYDGTVDFILSKLYIVSDIFGRKFLPGMTLRSMFTEAWHLMLLSFVYKNQKANRLKLHRFQKYRLGNIDMSTAKNSTTNSRKSKHLDL